MAKQWGLLLQKQSTWTYKYQRIIFALLDFFYLAVWVCLKMGYENMLMVGLLQIGAKHFTVQSDVASATRCKIV